MKISPFLYFMFSIASFSAFADQQIESDYDRLLLNSCQALAITPEQENAKPCIYFIRGFVSAAEAIDPAIFNEQTKKPQRSYGLMSRTPAGWARNRPTRYPLFCVANNESKAHMIKVVSKHLPAKSMTVKSLGDTILKILKVEYPCRQPDIN